MPSDKVDPNELFECRQCGKCCKGYGGTYVSETDIEQIARYIDADCDHFVDRYCHISGRRPLLAQRRDGYCVFWNQLCTIHPVKPLMCRKWPFLESLLVDSGNWLIMADACPGIRPDIDFGKLKKFVRLMISCNWNFGL
jgi:Fe-S-cluster containining protein